MRAAHRSASRGQLTPPAATYARTVVANASGGAKACWYMKSRAGSSPPRGGPVEHAGDTVLLVDEDVGGIEFAMGEDGLLRPQVVVGQPRREPLLQRGVHVELLAHDTDVLPPALPHLVRRAHLDAELGGLL